MRTTHRTVLSIAVLGAGLALAGCSSDSDGEARATPVPTTSSPTSSESPAPTTDATEDGTAGDDSLTDGTQEVLIQSYAGTYLAPTVEGGVALVPDAAANEVPARWVVSPVESGGVTYQITTVAQTDGEPSCLTVALGGDPSLATCDDTDTSQVFVVKPLDSPDQVAISTVAGHLGVDTESGNLTVYDTGDQLSSTFMLVAE